MQKALELDPTSLVIATDIAELYYFRRDYREAEARLEEVLRIDKLFDPAVIRWNMVRHKRYGTLLADLFAKEVKTLEKQYREKSTDKTKEKAKIKRYRGVLERNDKRELADTYWNEFGALKADDSDNYYDSAFIAVVAGKTNKSIELLEKSYSKREFLLPFIAIDPIWDDIRDNRRFKEIVRKMSNRLD